jgi:predicted nuclease of predicted toxin-antitoxin system
MKLLLDTCVWAGAKGELAAAGHDVVWVGDWPQDPGDEELLSRAHADGRIVVTLDKDFGELAIVRGQPHAGIIRLVADARERRSIVEGFAPRANKQPDVAGTDREIDILISTDVLSEGQNLQDCAHLINYDLHWNPTRMVQRAGRVDRIGTEFEALFIRNMFPEEGLGGAIFRKSRESLVRQAPPARRSAAHLFRSSLLVSVKPGEGRRE